MSEPLSANAKAILLLTAPLITGRRAPGDRALKPLSLKGEYHPLARRLHDIKRMPADLLGADAGQVLSECLDADDPTVGRLEPGRIQALLGRGMQLSLAVESWRARAIWILSRADEDYPSRLKGRLGGSAPAVLYGCGDRSFLDDGGLAVVGPRAADEDLLGYARRVGEFAARSNRTVVSGGARGVDREAMGGALDAGGRALGVLANDLARAATQRENRSALLNGTLLFVSPYDPASRFWTSQAMERNHTVYGLADASLVVDAMKGRGGTWAGAKAQLERARPERPSACPVFVRDDPGSEGLEALKDLGAQAFPDPQDAEQFEEALDRCKAMDKAPAPGEQQTLPPAATPSILSEPRRSPTDREASASREAPAAGPSLADRLWESVRNSVWRICSKAPQSERDIHLALDLDRPQAQEWLQRLVEEGVLQRKPRPVRYSASATFVRRGIAGPLQPPNPTTSMKQTGKTEPVLRPTHAPDRLQRRRAGRSSRSAGNQFDARERGGRAARAPDEKLRRAVRDLAVEALSRPKRPADVADELGLRPRQAERWLKRLSDEGYLRLHRNPVRYYAAPSLFR